MAVLTWNVTGEKNFETGIEKGALYIDGMDPQIWPGLISVTNTPEGGEVSPTYFDGIKYQDTISRQEFKATIKTYYVPYEFNRCLGIRQVDHEGLNVTQQSLEFFNLAYQTIIGNDTEGPNKGYKIHLIYNAIPTVSDNNFQTISNNISPNIISINISTVQPILDSKPVSSYWVIDSTKHTPQALSDLKDILYGTQTSFARFPTPIELLTILGG